LVQQSCCAKDRHHMARVRRSIQEILLQGSKDMLYRQMLTVKQYKEESLEVYFQKKASLCVQCNLEFADAKHAIIEGLTDTSLANTLVAIKHSNFEEVWDSIQEYERMIRQRGGRTLKRARHIAKATEEPKLPHQIFIRLGEQDKPAV
jgi:low affinity Fe/Cu permease